MRSGSPWRISRAGPGPSPTRSSPPWPAAFPACTSPEGPRHRLALALLGRTVREVGMRMVTGALLVLATGTGAFAQDQGSVALDAMTTPGRHFGIGYYVTDRLSIRPSLGFGYSDGYGAVLNLGTDARFELLPQSRLNPYLTAGFNYQRNPNLIQYNGQGS